MKFDLKEHMCVKVSALFANESDHMLSFATFESVDVRFSIRRHSLILVSQVQSSYSNLDSSIAYLAVNYIDRFLSKQVVLEYKPWIVRVLVVAGFSLAAKMMNVDLSLPHIQRDIGLNFDIQPIHRMEAWILTTLQWRLRSITPFSFLEFFISMFQQGDSSLKQRASDFIFITQYEIKLFECKPSVIAASALLCAADELIPLQFSSFLAAISECQYLNMEELMSGWTVLRQILMEDRDSTLDAEYYSTLTPKSVLECESTSSQ